MPFSGSGTAKRNGAGMNFYIEQAVRVQATYPFTDDDDFTAVLLDDVGLVLMPSHRNHDVHDVDGGYLILPDTRDEPPPIDDLLAADASSLTADDQRQPQTTTGTTTDTHATEAGGHETDASSDSTDTT